MAGAKGDKKTRPTQPVRWVCKVKSRQRGETIKQARWVWKYKLVVLFCFLSCVFCVFFLPVYSFRTHYIFYPSYQTQYSSSSRMHHKQ